MGLKKILVGVTTLIFAAIIGHAIYDTTNQDFKAIEKKRDNPTEAVEMIPPLANGTLAPAFELKDRNGKAYSLQQYRSKKLVLLEFFNPFCPHCQKSTPFLNFIHDNLSDEVQILAISTLAEKNTSEISGLFAKELKVEYPILERPSPELLKSYNIQGVPLAYLVDTDGKIVWSHLGTFNQAVQFEFEQQLQTAQKSSKKP